MSSADGHVPYRMRPTWMEVDLDCIAHNVIEIRRVIGQERLLIAVAKGNAYGLGLLGVVPTLVESGADLIAVGDPEDAISLRKSGHRGPLLLFGSYLPESIAREAVDSEIIPTIWDLHGAKVFSQVSNRRLDVFLKIDTGFHRLGVTPEEAADVAQAIARLPNLNIMCVYTHFAAALDPEYVRVQFDRFQRALDAIRSVGIEPPFACAASSAGVSTNAQMYLNAVDPGRLLYGLYYPENPPVALNLVPALKAVKTRIIQMRWVEAGDTVGYARAYCHRRTLVGVLPFGWGDGLPSDIANKAMVLVHGKRCPIIVAPNIEHSLVDLTDVDEAKVGDEAVFIGEQEGEGIALAEQAKWAETTELEISIQLGRTLPHVYAKRVDRPSA